MVCDGSSKDEEKGKNIFLRTTPAGLEPALPKEMPFTMEVSHHNGNSVHNLRFRCRQRQDYLVEQLCMCESAPTTHRLLVLYCAHCPTRVERVR